MGKPFVLILCTGNSCRSQMAEGILRAQAGDLVEVASAGSKPAGYVHPKAIAVMQEIGIDLSANESKSLEPFLQREVHTVITVCGRADQACPSFPGQLVRHHWGFEDPAHATGGEEEVLAVFRRVRDELVRVFEAYAAGLRMFATFHGLKPTEAQRDGSQRAASWALGKSFALASANALNKENPSPSRGANQPC